ncbi:MAG: CHAT domain-containing protein [bacterium]
MRNRYVSRLIHALIVGSLFGGFLLTSGVATAQSQRAAALRDSIFVLEQRGEFERALPVAHELLAVVKADTSSLPWEITEEEWRVGQIEHECSLPDSARDRIAWVARQWSRAQQLALEGNHQERERILEDVLPVVRKWMRQQDDDEAWCLLQLASTKMAMLDYRGAAKYCREGLARQERGRGKDTRIYAATLHFMGIVVGDRLVRSSEGAELEREALDIQIRLFGPDHPNVVTTKLWLSGFLYDLGEVENAREISLEYVSAYRRAYGNTAQTGFALTNAACRCALVGEYDQAECWLQEGLGILRETLGPDHYFVGFNLHWLGVLKMWQGDYESADELQAEALRIHRAASEGESELTGMDLYRYAEVKYRRGDYTDAETLAREALESRLGLLGPEHVVTADSMTLLAYILIERASLDEAEELFSKASVIYERMALIQHMAVTLDCYAGLAKVHMARGEYERAESACKRSLADVERLGENWHARGIETLILLGRICIAQGDMVGAEDHLERAALAFEITRRRVSTQKLNRTSYAAMASPYPLLAAVKIELGKDTEAWEAAERDRGRALLDLLASKDARGLTPEEVEEERRLDAELIRLSGVLDALQADSSSAPSEVNRVENQLLIAQSEWAAYQKGLQEKYPISEGQSYPLTRIQSMLEPRSVVIGWLNTGLGSYAYTVPKKGKVTWVKISTTEPSTAPERFVELVSTPGGMTEARDRFARRVYEERLEPLLRGLEDVDHLYVVPSGAMSGVPVEALIAEDETRVIDRWDVTCVPSASVLAWVKEKPDVESDVSLFAMGDPPFNETHARAMDEGVGVTEVAMMTRGEELEAVYRSASVGNAEAIARLERLGGTRQEVEAIGRLFEVEDILLGREASEQAVVKRAETDELGKYRYFHIATHAIPNNEHGLESSLVLSQVDLPNAYEAAMAGERIIDGRLTVGEIAAEWRLDADLVTLSACETALGQRSRGEGYIGFAHAFFHAGARTVVLSLWKVADRPTRLLMEQFYTNMITEGMTKSAALREAKMWLRDLENRQGETPYADPFYWSAFVLIGAPG